MSPFLIPMIRPIPPAFLECSPYLNCKVAESKSSPFEADNVFDKRYRIVPIH